MTSFAVSETGQLRHLRALGQLRHLRAPDQFGAVSELFQAPLVLASSAVSGPASSAVSEPFSAPLPVSERFPVPPHLRAWPVPPSPSHGQLRRLRYPPSPGSRGDPPSPCPWPAPSSPSPGPAPPFPSTFQLPGLLSLARSAVGRALEKLRAQGRLRRL